MAASPIAPQSAGASYAKPHPKAAVPQDLGFGTAAFSATLPNANMGRAAGAAPRRGLLARFWQGEGAAVTVEFVVLMPVLVLLVLFIAWASAVIARASNVQEIAHDMARAALRHSALHPASGLCAALETAELEPAIRRSGETLPVSRFTFECTAKSNSPYLGLTQVEIGISYAVAGDAIGDLGRSFGWTIARIERRSVMIY